MDNWQKALYTRLADFIGSTAENESTEGIEGRESVRLGITEAEAYVLMKALEDQEKYQNPLLEVTAEQ